MKIPVANRKILTEGKEIYFYTSPILQLYELPVCIQAIKSPLAKHRYWNKVSVNSNFILQVFLPISPNEERLF